MFYPNHKKAVAPLSVSTFLVFTSYTLNNSRASIDLFSYLNNKTRQETADTWLIHDTMCYFAVLFLENTPALSINCSSVSAQPPNL